MAKLFFPGLGGSEFDLRFAGCKSIHGPGGGIDDNKTDKTSEQEVPEIPRIEFAFDVVGNRRITVFGDMGRVVGGNEEAISTLQ